MYDRFILLHVDGEKRYIRESSIQSVSVDPFDPKTDHKGSRVYFDGHGIIVDESVDEVMQKINGGQKNV